MKQVITKLLILADDLTGALDSGVQFTGKGDKVLIMADRIQTFENIGQADVLVVNTDTRHIPAADAYQVIFELVKKAVQAGIHHIYKKTDSGLRGNVGAELTAVLDATGLEKLYFVPAWPKMGRTTINGVHYVNGVPLAESIFAKDVIDPVTESEIEALIRQQSDVKITRHGISEPEQGIIIFDCRDDDELTSVAGKICADGDDFWLAAGCAGLLEKLPRQSEGPGRDRKAACLQHELLVLSGSMNDVTRKQLDNAEKNGAYRVHVPMDRIVKNTWSDEEILAFSREFLKNAAGPVSVMDTMAEFGSCSLSNEVLASRIAGSMGKTARCLLELGADKTIMIIGGDTLLGFIHELGINALEPVKEMAPGIVLAEYSYRGNDHYLITKSGGFGTDDQLTEIQKLLQEA